MIAPDNDQGFLSSILRPGSALEPRALLILDAAFAALLAILLILAVLTKGNIHIFVLIAIELCLWASVKFFVNELKNSAEKKDA
ncbi:hypothetical protein MKEN_00071700 [Mycena kentingensis (nom. inval.)]|nr:hypothetical protein MKEN_00071700 [Mycena kentingensis (nom. inval.)]